MNQNLLENIRIVLVEPAGELNLGSIARVMKNMGLTKLVLVNPKCDREFRIISQNHGGTRGRCFGKCPNSK